MSICKDDIKALRKADSVSFHPRIDGATIVCTRKATTDGYEHELKRNIEVDVLWQRYDKDFTLETGFAWVSSAQYDMVWQTAARTIKAGDTLTVICSPHALQTETLTSAGLHGDQMSLRAQPKNTDKPFNKFHIDQCINPGNTARMYR